MEIPLPEGYEFTEGFKAPKKGDYWLSLTALLQENFEGKVMVMGPLGKNGWWPETHRRIIVRKTS